MGGEGLQTGSQDLRSPRDEDAAEVPPDLRFAVAHRYARALLVGALLLLVAGYAIYGMGRVGRLSLPFVRAAFVLPKTTAILGVGLWMAASGLLGAGLVAWGRLDMLTSRAKPGPPPPLLPTSVDPAGRTWRQVLDDCRHILRTQAVYWRSRLDGDALTSWVQTLASGLVALVGLWFVLQIWRAPAGGAAVNLGAQRISGVVLIGITFPLLVLERTFANLRPDRLPEAGALNRLSRVPLVASLVLGASLVLASAGLTWAPVLQIAVLLLLAAVGAELALRSAAFLFMPFPPAPERKAAADSRLAGVVLRLGWPNWRKTEQAIRSQLGIDLSRSWALAFLRRAALPLLLGMAGLAWLLTGVTALGVNQRGVYERFGAPAAVFGSGVHWHAPWPIGAVRPVENGVIHQLPIEFLLPTGDKGQAAAKEAAPAIVPAEARPSEESDRLWTGDHPFEGSYLIASEEAGRQSFQLVDTDMAVIYRVGPTDAAAMNAAYRLESPDDLIQALSGQLLVRYFVQHRLLDIIGENREGFARSFQTELQRELDALSSGLQVLSVSIEAIHPPPGAAAAYHDVQAAEIRAKAAVFSRQANATVVVASAQQTALRSVAGAAGAAADLTSQARIDAAQFEADRQAYAKAGSVFLFERRLEAVSKALAKPRSTVILDHQLTGAQNPVIDLRGARQPVSVDDESE